MSYQSVAVVDAHGGNAVVWHVDVSPNDSGLSRLSGAWVLPKHESDILALLVKSRHIAATANGLKVCPGGDAGVIDLDGTAGYVEAEIARLQRLFEEEIASKPKSKLVAPRWPGLPERIDLVNPPRDRNAPKNVAVALGIARWLEAVALAWVSVEQQRTARASLHGASPGQRPFPIRALQDA